MGRAYSSGSVCPYRRALRPAHCWRDDARGEGEGQEESSCTMGPCRLAGGF